MRYYPEPERPLEPPEPRVFCSCSVCGWEIYEGEEYWNIDGESVCEDCSRDFDEEYFENFHEIAGKVTKKEFFKED